LHCSQLIDSRKRPRSSVHRHLRGITLPPLGKLSLFACRPIAVPTPFLAKAPTTVIFHRAGVTMPELGKKLPPLKGLTGDGSELRLAGLKGQWVVVYFYPKDSTPGCTTEAKDFRDLYSAFRKRHAEVIGVSRDSLKSHANFSAKQELPFPLIADVDESWCQAFDVIHEKVLYGKRHLGIVRSTFLIDPDGKLSREWRGVKVPGHAQAVLDAVASK
jgi:peroxiredoxin Q/BCP